MRRFIQSATLSLFVLVNIANLALGQSVLELHPNSVELLGITKRSEGKLLLNFQLGDHCTMEFANITEALINYPLTVKVGGDTILDSVIVRARIGSGTGRAVFTDPDILGRVITTLLQEDTEDAPCFTLTEP